LIPPSYAVTFIISHDVWRAIAQIRFGETPGAKGTPFYAVNRCPLCCTPIDGRRQVVVWKTIRNFRVLFLRSRRFCAYWERESFQENGRRKQKSGSVEKAGLYPANHWGRVRLPDGNGLVPYENERHGPHEVRRTAERVWLRKPEAVQDRDNREARARAVSLAMAAPWTRVSGASG